MAKVTSFWYKDGDGNAFHAKDKALILGVCTGFHTFNDLAKMIIHREWLQTHGEVLTESMKLAEVIKDEYIREMPKLLKGCGWLNRMAVHRLAEFLVVVHKNDDMYYERLGYLMGRFILRSDEWIVADKDQRFGILKEERVLYFSHEKREDRIAQLQKGWDFLEMKYDTDSGIERSINFLMERLNVHRAMFNQDEVSRLGLKAFYPEHWYPVGRGQMWDMVHGGRG